MWYGAMGTSQILLFSLIAVKIKTNAPGAVSNSRSVNGLERAMTDSECCSTPYLRSYLPAMAAPPT